MRKKLFFALTLLTLVAPVMALAANLEFIAPLPTFGSRTIPTNLPEYFRNVYIFGFYIAVFLAVLMIVWGGIEYAVSGAIDRKSDAKNRILSAIGGLVLLLATVVILNILNPNLTQFQNIVPSVDCASQQAQGKPC